MRKLIPIIVLAISSSISAQQGPAPVVVAPVEQRTIELTRPLVATVEAVTSTTLAAETEGLVQSRDFDEGQLVEQGKVLVTQDVQLLEAEKAAAEANVRSAEALIAQARAEHRNARQELERLKGLYESNTATEKEFRDAITRADVAEATVTAREAELASRNAALQRLSTQIEKSTVKSPINGVIARRYVEVGQWLRQGDPVADVVQLDPLFVRVGVPENIAPRVQVGDEAKVVIDALGLETTGKVEQILPRADPATRTIPMNLRIDNPKLTIRPGFFARVVLVSNQDGQYVTVPKDAVVTQDRQSRVVAVREGVAALVPVKLGPSDGTYIAVSGELAAGETVVIRGNEALYPGRALHVTNPPGAQQHGRSGPPGQPEPSDQPETSGQPAP